MAHIGRPLLFLFKKRWMRGSDSTSLFSVRQRGTCRDTFLIRDTSGSFATTSCQNTHGPLQGQVRKQAFTHEWCIIRFSLQTETVNVILLCKQKQTPTGLYKESSAWLWVQKGSSKLNNFNLQHNPWCWFSITAPSSIFYMSALTLKCQRHHPKWRRPSMPNISEFPATKLSHKLPGRPTLSSTCQTTSAVTSLQ